MDDLKCARCDRVINPAYVRPVDGCVFCEGDRNRRETDALSFAIKAMKAAPPKESEESAAITRLIALGHPNATGCIKAICHPAEQPRQQQRRRA